MKRAQRHSRHPSGAIALLTIVTISAFTLAIVTAVSVIATSLISGATTHRTTEQVFFAAESGLQDALYRIGANAGIGNYSTTIGGNTVTVTIVANGFSRKVIARAVSPTTNITRTVSLDLTVPSFGGALAYAAQAGDGGIILDNTATIYGDVYSNGSIVPNGGGAAGSIRKHPTDPNFPGNVVVAKTNSIKQVAVLNGDSRAYTLDDMTVGKKAYYQTLNPVVKANGGAVTCTVAGDATFCNANAGQQPSKPLFITDDSTDPSSPIPRWVGEITDPGNPNVPKTPNPASCPNSFEPFPSHNRFNDGTYYCPPNNQVLGRQKISGDMYVGNGNTLNLSGNVYVTGKVVIDNGATVQLQQNASNVATYLIISEGEIDIDNLATLRGSGNASSFLLIASRSASTDAGSSSPAIYASNNSNAVIFVAPKGMVKVKNNGHLRSTVANIVKIMNGADITFNPALLSIFVPSSIPPTVPYIDPTSWKEL